MTELSTMTMEQLSAEEEELVEMADQLEAMADRVNSLRSQLTVELAKRETVTPST